MDFVNSLFKTIADKSYMEFAPAPTAPAVPPPAPIRPLMAEPIMAKAPANGAQPVRGGSPGPLGPKAADSGDQIQTSAEFRDVRFHSSLKFISRLSGFHTSSILFTASKIKISQ